MAVFQAVRSEQDVLGNILNYEAEVVRNRQLRGRFRRHPAWYAFQDESGIWHFGPSKFVGYCGMTPDGYLDNSRETLDGKETEPVLKAWFDPVEEGTDLHAELVAAFASFAGQLGAEANKRWRVSVPKSRRKASGRKLGQQDNLSGRVVSNPAICGGRPTIKGTRIRVSDVVEMIGHGVSEEEILSDYPSLAREDIRAALLYAAKALDHAVRRAA